MSPAADVGTWGSSAGPLPAASACVRLRPVVLQPWPLDGSDAEQDGEDEVLEQIVERLDLALMDIRTTPIVAADELEIAWKLLVEVTKPASSLSIPSGEILNEEDNDD